MKNNSSDEDLTKRQRFFGYSVIIELITFVGLFAYFIIADRTLSVATLISVFSIFSVVALQLPLLRKPDRYGTLVAQTGALVILISAVYFSYKLEKQDKSSSSLGTINVPETSGIRIISYEDQKFDSLLVRVKNGALKNTIKTSKGLFIMPSDIDFDKKELTCWVSKRIGNHFKTGSLVAKKSPNSEDYLLEKLDWEQQEFIDRSLSRKKPLKVGVIIPSVLKYETRDERRSAVSTPSSLAGESLSLGAMFFKRDLNRSRRIETIIREDKVDIRLAEEHAENLIARGAIAIVGSYNSRVTSAIRNITKPQNVPLITTDSSALALKDDSLAPNFFRLTVNNRRRAEILIAHLIEQRKQHKDNSDLVILYESDSGRSRIKGHDYSNDQVNQLRWTLQRAGGNGIDNITYYSFMHEERKSSFSKYDLDHESFHPLEKIKNESDFLKYLSEKHSSRGLTIILVGLDNDIVKFASAQQNIKNHFQWYVPGPREVFEFDWSPYYEQKNYLNLINGWRILSPGDSNSGYEWWRFSETWKAIMKDTPLPARAIRMYDALSIIEVAVNKVDSLDRVGIGRHVSLEVYRELLREQILNTKHRGVGGLIAFDEYGESLAPLYLLQKEPDGLKPLWRSSQPSINN